MPQSMGRLQGRLKEMLPTGRRLLIRPHETPTYKGSIILPDNCKQMAPCSGVIAALGFDLQDDPDCRLKEGDAIVYSKYAGVEFTFDDQHRVMIIHEDDVLALLYGEDGSEVTVGEVEGA
jgi:chaperonin GroES